MDIIIIGLFIFIVGIGLTMVYDKHKDVILSKSKEIMSRPKSQGAPVPPRSQGIDGLIQEIRERARQGTTTVDVKNGSETRTMTVQDLIKELERLKKQL